MSSAREEAGTTAGWVWLPVPAGGLPPAGALPGGLAASAASCEGRPLAGSRSECSHVTSGTEMTAIEFLHAPPSSFQAAHWQRPLCLDRRTNGQNPSGLNQPDPTRHTGQDSAQSHSVVLLLPCSLPPLRQDSKDHAHLQGTVTSSRTRGASASAAAVPAGGSTPGRAAAVASAQAEAGTLDYLVMIREQSWKTVLFEGLGA